MITRINKIDGYRVFSSFSWPADLPDFGRCNLIYGWNGSGKTTLSNILRYLEKKQSISEGRVEFQFDGNPCSGETLSTESEVPTIRVFNQHYRDDSVFATVQQLKPIFFLGKDSVDKQKKIEELTAKRARAQKDLDEQNTAKIKAAKAFDEFCIREAKTIKALLSSSGTNWYNNYDKAYFKYASEDFAKVDVPLQRLTEEERERLKKQKEETPKDAIPKIVLVPLNFEELRGKTDQLLQRTVVSQIIEDLSADPSLAEWVLAGIEHHTGKKHSEKCRFCESQLPEGRIERLRAHFNNEYNQLLTDLETTVAGIETTQKEFNDLQLPAKSAFYDHLTSDFANACTKLNEFINQSGSYLTQLSAASEQKRSKPFESIKLASVLHEMLPATNGSATTEAVNSVIDRHNTETTNFEIVITEARKSLERDFVLEALPEFKEKSQKIRTIEEDIRAGISIMKSLSEQISALEKDILEHQRPADELSSELRSYLGRDELTFSVRGNGYQITRNGILASNLSEGERTAIALLYFLKSLQDKEFSLSKDIVVIDDPVSSLDANSLFCAFGYIKERTKDAGQLFILTHNFVFFRQVKNWFNHLLHQKKKNILLRPARFYMVEAGIKAGKRNACLKALDPLLHEYESEYHYLFKRVYDEANSQGANRRLEEFYPMPNIARRVLESFLSFRYPNHAGQLEQQVGFVNFNPAKKARILRFLHTHSHDGKISEPEHDLSILAETPEVLKDMLEMLKAEDSRHCDEMLKLISPPPAVP
jgi:wobble nucleotide-excising tRNase